MSRDMHPFLLNQSSMQILAGGGAGLIEISIMQPLDLIKTRLQIYSCVHPGAGSGTSTVAGRHLHTSLLPSSSGHALNQYSSIFDCFRKIYRKEGILSLWKGMMPSMLIEVPKRAIKFFTFEQYRRILSFGADNSPPMTIFVAGFGAGISEALIVNPFEVIKVEMQANARMVAQMPNTWSVTKEIIKTQGILGLNKGLSATMYRNAIFNAVYFGFYHNLKRIIPEAKDARIEFLRHFAIGLTSGTVGCVLNIPFDVAKSRIQGPQPVACEIKYRGAFGTITTIYKEEGFLALYKGLSPKLLRLGPGSAIVIVVYEYSYGFLKSHF